MLKKILIALASIIGLYFILCIIGNSDSRVERMIEINAPAETIKNTLYDFKIFQEQWSPYTKYDPQMKTNYTGTVGERGYKLSWESDKEQAGKGSLTYQYTHGDTIMNTLHFDDFGDSENYYILKQQGEKSQVVWGMYSHTPFMFRAMSLFMSFEEMIAPDFEEGLKNLKKLIEQKNTN